MNCQIYGPPASRPGSPAVGYMGRSARRVSDLGAQLLGMWDGPLADLGVQLSGIRDSPLADLGVQLLGVGSV